MPLPDKRRFIPEDERQQLLGIAVAAIKSGLCGERQPAPGSITGPGYLAEKLASFVTLKINGALRGCIGSLEAHTTLADDVFKNAWAAAFRDPRFRPLKDSEFTALSIQISVLSEPEAVEFTSEQELIGKLRPGIDGLILRENVHRGTFLPSVWESLNKPAVFLQQLKLKAGLTADYWSETIEVWRYTTESFSSAASAVADTSHVHFSEIPR